MSAVASNNVLEVKVDGEVLNSPQSAEHNSKMHRGGGGKQGVDSDVAKATPSSPEPSDNVKEGKGGAVFAVGSDEGSGHSSNMVTGNDHEGENKATSEGTTLAEIFTNGVGAGEVEGSKGVEVEESKPRRKRTRRSGWDTPAQPKGWSDHTEPVVVAPVNPLLCV